MTSFLDLIPATIWSRWIGDSAGPMLNAIADLLPRAIADRAITPLIPVAEDPDALLRTAQPELVTRIAKLNAALLDLFSSPRFKPIQPDEITARAIPNLGMHSTWSVDLVNQAAKEATAWRNADRR